MVEAAGNGAENLDDPLYDRAGPGFPAAWRNPFNRDEPRLGCGRRRRRCPAARDPRARSRARPVPAGFSNYGARVDAQGWGREVTTTGYGDLQGGADEDVWYTDRFSGTSSASPIVVGAVACCRASGAAGGRG